MKYVVCAIYDAASQMFGRPFFVAATGHAVRSFRDEVAREAPDNDLYKHPEDFTLYHFGSFDDNDGEWHLHAAPELLVRGKDVKSLSE